MLHQDPEPPVLRLPVELVELIVYELAAEWWTSLAALRGNRTCECDGNCTVNTVCQIGAVKRRSKGSRRHTHSVIKKFEPDIQAANHHDEDPEYALHNEWLWNRWTVSFSSANRQLRVMIFDGMLMETIKVKGMVVKDLERTIAVVGKRPVRTIVLGTAPVQNAPTFFSLLLKHYPSVTRLVVRSKRCTPLEPNVPVYIVKPGEGIQHIELELQEAGNYTAMRKIKSKERQVVRELRLRESAACMPWMVSRRHELGLVLQVYRGVEYLALDFGLNPSALEPYSKTAFRGLRDDTLPDLVSLKLRFEPALQPSPAPQDLFFPNSSALFIRLSKLQHVQIIFRNDPRSRKVRLRNEIHATTTWTHECPTFPYSRKKALGLLFPSPEKVEAYIQDLVHWSRSLRTFHVAYTDKNRPNDAHPPLDLRFVIRHGRVVCRRAIYDTSRLLDLLPVSDDILLGRYNQAENKTLLRNWIQEGATQEERDERHNIRWLEYNRRQARANAWLASQTSGV